MILRVTYNVLIQVTIWFILLSCFVGYVVLGVEAMEETSAYWFVKILYFG